MTGIGAVRAKRITDAWAEQKIVREIMLFLHSNGAGTARAVRIFETLRRGRRAGHDPDPYRLARDIRGIGFKSADAIAMRLGIEKIATTRLRAGISYALTEAMDQGHCGLPTEAKRTGCAAIGTVIRRGSERVKSTLAFTLAISGIPQPPNFRVFRRFIENVDSFNSVAHAWSKDCSFCLAVPDIERGMDHPWRNKD